MSEQATCGAKTRSGHPCKNTAGKGTDHLGEGRCKHHGGASPIKSGRYSTVKRDGLRDLIEKHRGDEKPLDIMEELATARAMLEDYVSRLEEPDVAEVISQLERITKIAQREKKLLLSGAISRAHLERIYREQRRIIEHEADPETAERILDRFLSIRI